jgi:hypothetical protein
MIKPAAERERNYANLHILHLENTIFTNAALPDHSEVAPKTAGELAEEIGKQIVEVINLIGSETWSKEVNVSEYVDYRFANEGTSSTVERTATFCFEAGRSYKRKEVMTAIRNDENEAIFKRSIVIFSAGGDSTLHSEFSQNPINVFAKMQEVINEVARFFSSDETGQSASGSKSSS